ncbi:MAG: DUF3307 domain-containing protein [Clostridia bacterium]|nr:DUF3307 domain-containing protein [Clostridia bacterium]
MSMLFTFLLMVFFHIVDDYYLQGWLSSAKQKKWWQDNAPQSLYKYDYLVALFMHSFSWTFMIMLPLAIRAHFNPNTLFLILFVMNIAIHSFVDDLKANRKRINLIVDQSIHMVQIIITFSLLV